VSLSGSTNLDRLRLIAKVAQSRRKKAATPKPRKVRAPKVPRPTGPTNRPGSAKAQQAQYMRAKYQERRNLGLCTLCAQPAEGKTRCKACNELRNKRQDAKRKAARIAGVCTQCSARAVEGGKLCQRHRDEFRERERARRRRLRETNEQGEPARWVAA
jgi:hypothetical protein